MFKKIRESAENALKSTVESTIHAFRDISTPTFESILSLEEVEAREKQAALSNAPPLPPVVPFVVLHEKPIEAFAMIKDALVIFLHELHLIDFKDFNNRAYASTLIEYMDKLKVIFHELPINAQAFDKLNKMIFTHLGNNGIIEQYILTLLSWYKKSNDSLDFQPAAFITLCEDLFLPDMPVSANTIVQAQQHLEQSPLKEIKSHIFLQRAQETMHAKIILHAKKMVDEVEGIKQELIAIFSYSLRGETLQKRYIENAEQLNSAIGAILSEYLTQYAGFDEKMSLENFTIMQEEFERQLRQLETALWQKSHPSSIDDFRVLLSKLTDVYFRQKKSILQNANTKLGMAYKHCDALGLVDLSELMILKNKLVKLEQATVPISLHEFTTIEGAIDTYITQKMHEVHQVLVAKLQLPDYTPLTENPLLPDVISMQQHINTLKNAVINCQWEKKEPDEACRLLQNYRQNISESLYLESMLSRKAAVIDARLRSPVYQAALVIAEKVKTEYEAILQNAIDNLENEEDKNTLSALAESGPNITIVAHNASFLNACDPRLYQLGFFYLHVERLNSAFIYDSHKINLTKNGLDNEKARMSNYMMNLLTAVQDDLTLPENTSPEIQAGFVSWVSNLIAPLKELWARFVSFVTNSNGFFNSTSSTSQSTIALLKKETYDNLSQIAEDISQSF